MSPWRRAFVRQAWLVSGSSLVILVALGVMLWNPWERTKTAAKGRLKLYCAAGISKPVREIAAQYEQLFSVTVEIDPDGSGKLLSKIRAAGGRGDLFLSAEQVRIDQGRKEGLIAETMPIGRLVPVLVVNRRTQESLRQQGRPVKGLNDLLREDLRVALADEGASIGALTKRVLEPMGLWTKIQTRRSAPGAQVSMTGTVNEVAQTVRIKDNYVGIVWKALALDYGELEVVDVPEFEGEGDQLTIGVLSHSQNPTSALHFARFMSSRDRGLPVFAQHHHQTIPDGDEWVHRPEITFFAGAMLKPGIDEVLKAFEQREGVNILTSYKGCGELVGQMSAMRRGEDRSSRFPDAYFSCDVSFMTQVQQWFGAAESITKNDIVMIVQKGNPKKIRSIEDLARPDLRIGLGEPEKSALGKLTDDLLKSVGLHDRVYGGQWKKRIVHSDTGHGLVNQLRAATQTLDAAVVYRSNAMANPENPKQYLDIIELNVGRAIAEQPFAIARDSKHKYLMRRLLAAIVAEQTADRFRSLGFHWVYGTK